MNYAELITYFPSGQKTRIGLFVVDMLFVQIIVVRASILAPTCDVNLSLSCMASL